MFPVGSGTSLTGFGPMMKNLFGGRIVHLFIEDIYLKCFGRDRLGVTSLLTSPLFFYLREER